MKHIVKHDVKYAEVTWMKDYLLRRHRRFQKMFISHRQRVLSLIFRAHSKLMKRRGVELLQHFMYLSFSLLSTPTAFNICEKNS